MHKYRTTRLQKFAARFARADRGATAVEFAMISLPLMVLIFGVVELAMVLLVATSLESAIESSARLIRTGEFQTGASSTKADFKAVFAYTEMVVPTDTTQTDSMARARRTEVGRCRHRYRPRT